MRILLDESLPRPLGRLLIQQNLATLPLAIVVLVAESNRLESLEPLVPDALETLKSLKPRTLLRVGA